MKKLAAVIFFAMVGTNAMAQAGGASSGAGGTAPARRPVRQQAP